MKKANHWGAIRVGRSEEKNHGDFHFKIESERMDSRDFTRRIYEEFLKELHIKSTRRVDNSASRKIKSFCFK